MWTYASTTILLYHLRCFFCGKTLTNPLSLLKGNYHHNVRSVKHEGRRFMFYVGGRHDILDIWTTLTSASFYLCWLVLQRHLRLFETWCTAQLCITNTSTLTRTQIYSPHLYKLSYHGGRRLVSWRVGVASVTYETHVSRWYEQTLCLVLSSWKCQHYSIKKYIMSNVCPVHPSHFPGAWCERADCWDTMAKCPEPWMPGTEYTSSQRRLGTHHLPRIVGRKDHSNDCFNS